MEYRPPLSEIVRSLPFTVPFVAPEALERQTGKSLRLRLGANESSFGVSPHALEAMVREAGRIGWYGDPENFELREALAAKHGVAIENVVVASGLDDVISLCARAFLNPGESAVTSLGGYPTFAYVVHGLGGTLELVPYRDDRNDLEGLVDAACTTRPKLAFLANPDNPYTGALVADLRASAASIGVTIEVLTANTNSEIDAAFESLAQKHVDALVVSPDNLFSNRRVQLITLSSRHAVPTIYSFREDVEAGGLMSYGADIPGEYRDVGIYVGRILKGEKPAELPVVQPTKFEFVVNLKAAKQIGLTIPQWTLMKADKVIQ